MAKKKTASQRTLVTFLLDRTGSMESIKDDTIGAFNAYVSGLKSDGANIEFTLVQFDTQSLDKICVAVPIAQAPKLDKSNYVPRAATPLIDAVYKTIQAVADSVKDKETKVVICIQTDGQENSSSEYTWAELNALIREKTALGWQFNFMGAGIDAYQQGAQMGIAAAATLSYDKHSPAATMSAFRAAASNTSLYASGRASNTNYSLAQKQAAGDRFHEQNVSRLVTPDPQSARTRTRIVDDFTL